jgi:hypothetical protein
VWSSDCDVCSLKSYPKVNGCFLCRRKEKMQLNRSDRQQANSTNPLLRSVCSATIYEWSPAERFVSGPALKIQCNKAVCRCAVCSPFDRNFHIYANAGNTITNEKMPKPLLDFIGSPCRTIRALCHGALEALRFSHDRLRTGAHEV